MEDYLDFHKGITMALTSVSSNTYTPNAQKPAAPRSVDEAARTGKAAGNDGDADNQRAQGNQPPAPAPAPKPVMNTLGQSIGGNLNVTA